ncbi:hypothetical protein OHA77_14280 [Streptosporangium sp. NBC_01639]|uniref:hypothetical protein n=1 Tax=Streptosporangium sp. NBC_01639 TaxID=2975948 RepID=UPI0038661EFD|nr:hypothetical protein OHA77_14280 [Streptosporangium sp. NBC_01639]
MPDSIVTKSGEPEAVHYGDDWVAMVNGTRQDAEPPREQVAMVLVPMGLRLSVAKTTVTYLDDGFVFLGHHIQRRRECRRLPIQKLVKQSYTGSSGP